MTSACFLFRFGSATQRSALAVVGRAETALDREAPQARNLLGNAARTHHPLHAVFGGTLVSNHRSSTIANALFRPELR